MKQNLLFILFYWMLCQNTYAQHQLGVGVNAGIIYQFAQKTDPFGAVYVDALNPMAGVEVEWKFHPTYSIQTVASISNFASMLNFKRNGFYASMGGSQVSSRILSLNLKKRFFSFSTRLFPVVDEVQLRITSGVTYTGFKYAFGGTGTSTQDDVLTDNSTDMISSQITSFQAGGFPLYNEYENFHDISNFYGQVGIEMSFVVRRISINYHIFYALGLNEFYSSRIEYKYYQEPIQHASLKYNGTGIGGTLGIRYHFDL